MSKRKSGLFGGRNSKLPISMTSYSGKDNPGFTHNEDGVSNNSTSVEPISIISIHPTLTNGAKVDSGAYSGATNGVLPSGDDTGPVSNGSTHPIQKQTSAVEMKRSINLLHCTAIMVAVTGHSSVFISPSSILAQTGSVGSSLIVWLIGGLINLGLALCFAELGTMFPKAGGPYSYAMKSFGPLMGFLMMWGYTVLIAGPFWAFLAYTAALYIVKPAFPDCTGDDVKKAVNILAGWIM
ncbi:putative L-type amino acid transporter 1-like protein MLAS, partial [Physella acuta]|uniref:putative L-type amino acid transporter 1-like protein MLAS n=1 Tax=Physella acuta TaxID=109671 RepID=UPI0027DC4BD4